MKKMFFGAIIFFGGLTGVLTFIILSVEHQTKYIDKYTVYEGLHGFLFGNSYVVLFYLFALLSLVGLVICAKEVYPDFFLGMFKEKVKCPYCHRNLIQVSSDEGSSKCIYCGVYFSVSRADGKLVAEQEITSE